MMNLNADDELGQNSLIDEKNPLTNKDDKSVVNVEEIVSPRVEELSNENVDFCLSQELDSIGTTVDNVKEEDKAEDKSEIYEPTRSELLEEKISSATPSSIAERMIVKPRRFEPIQKPPNQTDSNIPQSKIPRKATTLIRCVAKKRSNTAINIRDKASLIIQKKSKPTSPRTTSPIKPTTAGAFENKVLHGSLTLKARKEAIRLNREEPCKKINEREKSVKNIRDSNEITRTRSNEDLNKDRLAIESSKTFAQYATVEQRLSILAKRYETQLKRYKGRVKAYETAQGDILEAKSQLKTIHNQMLTSGNIPEGFTLPELPESVTAVTAENPEETCEALATANKNLKKLEREIKTLKENIKRKNNELETQKELMDQLQKKIDDFDEETQMYAKSFEEKKQEEINRLTKTYTIKLADIKERLDEKCEELIELEDDKKAEIERLHFQLREEVVKRKKLQHDLHQRINEIDDLNEEVEILKKELNKLNVQLDKQIPKIEKYEKDLKKAIEDKENAEEKYDEINKLLEDEKKLLFSLKDTIKEKDQESQDSKERLLKFSNIMIEKGDLIENSIKLLNTEQGQKDKVVDFLCYVCSVMGYNVDDETVCLLRSNDDQAVYKIKTDIENILNEKNQDLSKKDAVISSLELDLKQKQKLLEELLEFANVKNADTCKKSEKNQEEEKPAVILSLVPSTHSLNYDQRLATDKLMDILESRRHAMQRMEKQIKDLQDLHSYCGMRRILQESKIAELELMLASNLD